MPDKPLLDQLREAFPLISVGILTADLMSLGSELKLMEEAGVKLLHVDVMDGCFCSMMTLSSPEALSSTAKHRWKTLNI